jgi:CheY-like chemotaxis protein
MKVMIVDDHAGVRKLIRQLVGAPDDIFFEFATGEAAVMAARVFKPDWVTMDVRLPGLGGLEAARAIHAIHPPSRIVIVTSYDEPFLRQTASELGAVAYVLKENLAELRSVLLGEAIPPPEPSSAGETGPESARSGEQANPSLPDGVLAIPTPVGAGTRLRVLIVEDSEIDCELLRRQLWRCGFAPLIRRVDNGPDMRRALEQDFWDIVLTDCAMPRFSAVEALALIRDVGLKLPTVCVTGTIDPAKIAKALNSGAFEVIGKDNLTGIGPAVTRALNRK